MRKPAPYLSLPPLCVHLHPTSNAGDIICILGGAISHDLSTRFLLIDKNTRLRDTLSNDQPRNDNARAARDVPSAGRLRAATFYVRTCFACPQGPPTRSAIGCDIVLVPVHHKPYRRTLISPSGFPPIAFPDTLQQIPEELIFMGPFMVSRLETPDCRPACQKGGRCADGRSGPNRRRRTRTHREMCGRCLSLTQLDSGSVSLRSTRR